MLAFRERRVTCILCLHGTLRRLLIYEKKNVSRKEMMMRMLFSNGNANEINGSLHIYNAIYEYSFLLNRKHVVIVDMQDLLGNSMRLVMTLKSFQKWSF